MSIITNKIELPGLGMRAKARLEQLGMTQASLADRCDVYPTTINRVIKHDQIPSVHLLVKMSKVLYLSTDYLLGLSTDPYSTIDETVKKQAEIEYERIHNAWPDFMNEPENLKDQMMFALLQGEEYNN